MPIDVFQIRTALKDVMVEQRMEVVNKFVHHWMGADITAHAGLGTLSTRVILNHVSVSFTI